MSEVRQKICRVFPPFVMLSNCRGSPELSQHFSCMFSPVLSFTHDFLLSAGLSAHLDLLDSSSCDYRPYFSPQFLSESFHTLLSATPISAWLLFFSLSCKWFAWWFFLSCFYQASSSNIPAFTLFCPRFCLPSLSSTLGLHVLELLDFS